MKKFITICLILSLTNSIIAQNKEKYPLGDYAELTDNKPHDNNSSWDKQVTLPQLRWGSTDIRYSKLNIPTEVKSTSWKTKVKGSMLKPSYGVLKN